MRARGYTALRGEECAGILEFTCFSFFAAIADADAGAVAWGLHFARMGCMCALSAPARALCGDCVAAVEREGADGCHA